MIKKKKKTTLRDRLMIRWSEECEELFNLVEHHNKLMTTSYILEIDKSDNSADNINYVTELTKSINQEIVDKFNGLRIIDKQIKNLTSLNEKYRDLFYSVEDIANCLNNNVALDNRSFLTFMILLTANLGELQGRIESLPDSVTWKKDALDKLVSLLTGGKK